MIKVKCEDCDFWEPIEKGGTCKRYPPKPTPYPVQVAGRIQVGVRPSRPNFMDVMSWPKTPKTKADDWCGEFKNEQA